MYQNLRLKISKIDQSIIRLRTKNQRLIHCIKRVRPNGHEGPFLNKKLPKTFAFMSTANIQSRYFNKLIDKTESEIVRWLEVYYSVTFW